MLRQSVARLCFGAGQNPGSPCDKMPKVRRQLVKRREVREVSESCWKGPAEPYQYAIHFERLQALQALPHA